MSEENRYHNTKIYKLVDQIKQYYYIGSTTQPLCKRLYDHKRKCNESPNRKVYKYFNSIGWDNVNILLIAEIKLENREQQLKSEAEEVSKHLNDNLCLNLRRPIRTLEEKAEDQKKWAQTYRHRYSEKVRLKEREYRKQLGTTECGCGGHFLNNTDNTKRHQNSKRHQKWMNNKTNQLIFL